MIELFTTFLSLFVPAFTMLLVYALMRTKRGFIFEVWIIENRLRFFLTLTLLGTLASGLTFIEGFHDLFALIGLNTNASFATIGGFVGGWLIAAMRSKK